MRELALGDPARLATDVGPVIDAEAQRSVAGSTSRRCARAGTAVCQLRRSPDACAHGTFVRRR